MLPTRAAALPALLLLLAGCVAPGAAPGPLAAAGLAGPAPACAGPCLRAVDAGPSRPWEPSAAANPRDPAHLLVGTTVWDQDPVTGLRTAWIASHVSRDAGATWAQAPLPGGLSAGPGHPLFTYTHMGDSVATFLPDGTALHFGLAYRHVGPTDGRSAVPVFARTGYSLFAARSGDGGLTYPEVAVVAEGSGVFGLVGLPLPGAPVPALPFAALWEGQDKPWVAVGPGGELLVTWSTIHFAHPESPLYRCQVMASTSADGGRTWSAPGLVETGETCLLGAYPLLLGGAWLVAYQDLLAEELRLARSSDGGATWEAASLGPATPFPALAAQPLPGGGQRALLVHGDGSDPAESDFYWEGKVQPPVLRWSDDAGATWSDPLPLDQGEAPGRTVPSVVVAGDGTAYVTFLHPFGEGDAAGARLMAVAFRDGRASAPALLDPAIAGPTWRLGDYLGLAPTADGALASWTRSDDGEQYDLAAAVLGPPATLP